MRILTTGDKMDAVIHILSDACGIFIPRYFLTDGYHNVNKKHCEANLPHQRAAAMLITIKQIKAVLLHNRGARGVRLCAVTGNKYCHL